jgi:hypothetical protein
MSRLNRYNDFYIRQLAVKQHNKKKIVEELKFKEFQSMIEEGKKNDIVSLYLKNNSKVNENYSLILEDREMLQDTKKVVCAKFYQDRIKNIAIETRFYLESKNISENDIRLIEENIESILISEGFLDWVSDKVQKGRDVVKKGLSSIWNFLSDKAKVVWDSIVEDIFKPGLEALKNVATKLFGAEVVAAIEATAKKVINSFDEFLKTSKSIFDKVYSKLKDLAKNLANVVKEIWAKTKEILLKVWEFIKAHAIKIIPGLKPKLAKMSKLSEKVNPTNLGNEMKMISEDIKDMKKYFKGEPIGAPGGSFEEVATSSGEQLMSTGEGVPKEEGQSKPEGETQNKPEEKKEVVNDSFIWDSLKGFMAKRPDFDTEELLKLHETKIQKIYEAEESAEESAEHEGHKAESRGIKKWIGGIAMWVLSPFGKLMEIITDVVSKGLSAIPAWLSGKLGKMFEGAKGIVKYAAKFVAIGTLTAFIVGMSAEAFSLTTHIPGEWIKKAGEMVGLEGAVQKAEETLAEVGKGIEKSGIKLTDMKKPGETHESRLHKFEEFNRINESEAAAPTKGINWKGLAIGAGSALLGFLVSVFTHAIPGLHMSFEIISLVLLVVATLGYIFTETEWGKKIASSNSTIPGMAKNFYSFLHGGH